MRQNLAFAFLLQLGAVVGIQVAQSGGSDMSPFHVRRAEDCAYLKDNFGNRIPQEIEFDQAACACRWAGSQPSDFDCSSGEVWNPYHLDGKQCKPSDFFDSVLNHGLGEDCMGDADGFVVFTSSPSINSARTQEECPDPIMSFNDNW